MAWKVTFNSSLGIIESIYTGRVTVDEVKDAVARHASLTKETGSESVLVDASGIVEAVGGLMDVFAFPSGLFEKEGISKMSRWALVLPKQDKTRQIAEFFETVSRNHGWMVQCFKDRQETLDWLKSSGSTNKSDTGNGS